MRERRHKIAFLFGIDDHWGPLQMFEEVSDGISLLKRHLQSFRKILYPCVHLWRCMLEYNMVFKKIDIQLWPSGDEISYPLVFFL